MKTINEIFYSVQGEGLNAGIPAVFIRFAGCNLACPFCDTNHQLGREMEDDDIFDAAAGFDAPLIVLTGGEPAMQIDNDFITNLKDATRAKIAIETNGTIPLPDNIDWVTLSPKQGIEDTDLPIVINHADEIKVIDLGQELEPYFSLPCRTDETAMLLQPCFVANATMAAANRHRTVQRVLDDPRWRLSVQIHRYLSIK